MLRFVLPSWTLKRALRTGAFFCLPVILAGCGGINLFGDDDKEQAKASKPQTTVFEDQAGSGKALSPGPSDPDEIVRKGKNGEPDLTRAQLIQELKALRAELNIRSGRLKTDLTAAKAELSRRQSAGEIDESKIKLTPAQIRDSQLSELDQLRAELSRRKLTKTSKQETIATALTENEIAYRYIDTCLTRPKGDFRGLFKDQPELSVLVEEKENQVYRNSDQTILILTSKESCDVSFAGTSINDFTTGLTHILKTQEAIVETKKVAGLTVINIVHPRGNFRLASGKKVIGRGGSTNLYTTVTAL